MEIHSCPTCLTIFQSRRNLEKHKCLIRFCGPGETADLFVRDEGEMARMTKTLKLFGSSYRQIIAFCSSTKTVMPGVYPFFFTPRGHELLPVLSKIGCDSDCYSFLKKAAQECPVKLPKSLRIQVGENLLRIGPEVLLPRSKRHMKSLSIIDKKSYVLVEKKVRLKFL